MVLSPDCIARKYVDQVLLLEEFQCAGSQVVFVHRPLPEDPSVQFLLKIQGALAASAAASEELLFQDRPLLAAVVAWAILSVCILYIAR